MNRDPIVRNHSAQENIETVARLESEFLLQRTWTERIGDTIAGFAGSMSFVILHILWFITWFVINTGRFPGIKPFDPYPFVLLSVAVSCEAVLLSTFVLIRQNRMSRRADQRDHLNLQIDLLAEKEITKILQVLQSMCRHLGVKEGITDQELQELAQVTAVENLAKELEQKLPE